MIKIFLLREDALFASVDRLLLIVPVHEHIALRGVTVEVTEEKDVSAL